MAGRSGLDYAGVAAYLREVERIKPNRQWREIWTGIQAMERAALEVWEKQQQEKK